MVERDGQTGLELAKRNGLKNAAAVIFRDEFYDLTKVWPAGAKIGFLQKTDEAALSLLRHDAAHLLAQAVCSLYEGVQVGIGPATKDGFYYDFLFKQSIREEDLPTIEARMQALVDQDDIVKREEWDREKAIAYFQKQGQPLKVDLIQRFPEDAVISIYRQGDFLDLCRGPHLPRVGLLGKSFKLLRLAGAYWRGDASKPMLQRIYGTYFSSEKALRLHLKMIEEAKKRDHRRLGQALDLFHFQEEAQGDIFWHPKGWRIYTQLQTYLRLRLEKDGYQEIKTPQILSRALWEKSGHWDKFREAMITCQLPEAQEGKEPIALKPMNCPGHVQVFKDRIRSYKDLPLRLAEFGSCKRFEPSGALFGLMRLRAFTQDDAHIFCAPEMIEAETRRFCQLLYRVYADLGFQEVDVLFSDRPLKRAGEEEIWDVAEAALRKGAESAGLSCGLNPGEGAFYGPKLEFILKDALGRSWQCGTLQVDFILPERLDATYVGADGQKHRPVMLHRAILGSFERFIGILIEHYSGSLPLWLAPLHVVVLPVTNDQDVVADKVTQAFENAGLRVLCDKKSDKIHGKIRAYSMQKVPYIAVVGAREAETEQVSLRTFGKKENEVIDLEQAIQRLALEAKMPHDSLV